MHLGSSLIGDLNSAVNRSIGCLDTSHTICLKTCVVLFTAHTMLILSFDWVLLVDMASDLALPPLALAAAFPFALAFTTGEGFALLLPFDAGCRGGLREIGDDGRASKALFPMTQTGFWGGGQLHCLRKCRYRAES